MNNPVEHFLSRPLPAAVAACLALLALGCGDGRPARVPAAGKVVIDGKPVTSGAVRFKPADGRPATGIIQSDGSFVLSTFADNDGVVPGTYAVGVYSRDALSPTRVRWNVPKQYQNPSTSALSQTVTGPTDSLLIELTWGGKSGPIEENVRRGE